MESSAPRQTTDVFLADNWCLFRVSRPSVLLIGAEHDTDRAVQVITAHGEDAIAAWPTPLPAAAGVGRDHTVRA